MNIEQAIELTDEPVSFQKRWWTEVETPNATGMQLILRKLVKVERSDCELTQLLTHGSHPTTL